jgi:REP element-mobilizing transposase RayT
MKFIPEIHHRRSIRLKGYDYTQAGAYFITMVADQRQEIFGEVINGEMKLSALGQIVRDEWMQSSAIRKEIQLYDDELGIMLNHMHGIVHIVGADGVRPDLPSSNKIAAMNVNGSGVLRLTDDIGAIGQGAHRAPLPVPPVRAPKSLGAFVAGLKASVTSRARRELNLMDIWQRNYYDHIIRNEIDFENIWNYIDDNPRKWQEDQLHPSASPNKFNRS